MNFRVSINIQFFLCIAFLGALATCATFSLAANNKPAITKELSMSEMEQRVIKEVNALPLHSLDWNDLVIPKASLIVEVEVNKSGDVINAIPISGGSFCREASIEAVKKWKFQPISEAEIQSLKGKVGVDCSSNGNWNNFNLEEYIKWISREPNSWQAHLGLGKYYLQSSGCCFSYSGSQSTAALASKEIKAAIKLSPQDPVLHYFQGLALTQARMVPEALSEFQEALRLKPDFWECSFAVSIAYQYWGDLLRADTNPFHDSYTGLSLLPQGFRDGDLDNENGDGSQRKLDWEKIEKAENVILEVLKANNRDEIESIGYLELTKLYLKTDRFDKACDSYRKYVEINDKFKAAGMEFHWNSTLKRKDRCSMVDEDRTNFMGILLEAVGRYGEANEFYQRTISEIGTDVSPFLKDGYLVLEAQLRNVRVLKKFDNEAAVLRQGENYLSNLNKMFFAKSRLLKNISKLIDKPTAGQYQTERGLLLEAMGKDAEAMDAFQEATELTGSMRAYEGLYRINLKLGNKERATNILSYIEKVDKKFARYLKGDKNIFVRRL